MSLANPVSAADHVQGAADAKVTLVEYGDYQCPYCGAAYPIVKEIRKRFGFNVSGQAAAVPNVPSEALTMVRAAIAAMSLRMGAQCNFRGCGTPVFGREPRCSIDAC